MGRCLAFNFGPEELKEKLKDIKYFVYAPDFESGGASSVQSFATMLQASAVEAAALRQSLIAELGLSAREDAFDFGGISLVQFSYGKSLYIELSSREANGAISDVQLLQLAKLDRALCVLRAVPVVMPAAQDVVFGAGHLLASELAQPFQPTSGFYVPEQKDWIVGRNYAEAYAKWNESSKK